MSIKPEKDSSGGSPMNGRDVILCASAVSGISGSSGSSGSIGFSD